MVIFTTSSSAFSKKMMKSKYWSRDLQMLTSQLQASDPQTAGERDWQLLHPPQKHGSGCTEALPTKVYVRSIFCLFVLKAMKVAKTLPEVRGFWKLTWSLNLDGHLRSCDLQFFFGGVTWPRASFAAGNWGPSRIGGRKAGGGGAPSAGHPTPMPPPGIITP